MSLDLRLLEVPLEFDALEEHLRIVEDQIERSPEEAKLRRDNKRKAQDLTPCDPEWDVLDWLCDYEISIMLPRILRNPFLISLYSAYESVVTEIAGRMQKRLGQKTCNRNESKPFLDCAKKYYKNNFGFRLSENNQAWERLKILAGLRNAIVHASGRMDMVRDRPKEKIQKWEEKGIGIQCDTGYIIVSGGFLSETFALVKGDLEDLIARYKEWDDLQKASSTQ